MNCYNGKSWQYDPGTTDTEWECSASPDKVEIEIFLSIFPFQTNLSQQIRIITQTTLNMNERKVLNIEARARDGELFSENFYLKVSKSIDTND